MIRTKLAISALVVLALADSTALANNKWTGNGGSFKAMGFVGSNKGRIELKTGASLRSGR